jgi:hypothetical protein
MAKRFLVPLNLAPLSSDPASGSEGDAYFNTSTNMVRVYYDGEWNDLGGGGSSSDEIYYSSNPPASPELGDIWIDSTSNIDPRSTFLNLSNDGGSYNTTIFEFNQDGGDPSTEIFSFSIDGGTP